MKIYLIGMPLSGKTTIGKKLKERLGFDLVDTDEYIEKTYNVSIDHLLGNGHEDFFRSLETEALIDNIELFDTIISTGGGIVLNEDHLNLMDGFVVFLDAPLEVLKEREKESKKRPLLNHDNALAMTYERRIDLYHDFADIIINSTNIDEAVDEIIAFLEEEGLI